MWLLGQGEPARSWRAPPPELQWQGLELSVGERGKHGQRRPVEPTRQRCTQACVGRMLRAGSERLSRAWRRRCSLLRALQLAWVGRDSGQEVEGGAAGAAVRSRQAEPVEGGVAGMAATEAALAFLYHRACMVPALFQLPSGRSRVSSWRTGLRARRMPGVTLTRYWQMKPQHLTMPAGR